MKKKTPARRNPPARKNVSPKRSSAGSAARQQAKARRSGKGKAARGLSTPFTPSAAPGFVDLPSAPGAGAAAAAPGDVVELILRDHRPLKALIETMKNYGLDLDERQEAFERFAPLLARHARAEEQVLYAFLKSDDRLREDGLQGDVEHALAARLVEALEGTTDLELYSARVKVLAELVEHHLEAEERLLLPHLRRHLERDVLEAMGQQYLELRASLSPEEAKLGDAGAEGPNAVPAREALFEAERGRSGQEAATREDQDEPPDDVREDLPGSREADFH